LTGQLSAGRPALLWLPILVWAGIIFAFSATPNLRVAEAADVDFVIRKAGHMFVFGVLAVLIWRALAYSAVRRAVLWSWVLTAAYAATDESHQAFTAGRHPSAGGCGDRLGRSAAIPVGTDGVVAGPAGARRGDATGPRLICSNPCGSPRPRRPE
jgi:hypothetical protein